MADFIVRVFSFSVVPLLLSGAILLLDRSARTRERRLEVPLTMLFGVGVAAGGLSSFFGHFFVSDIVADLVGWPRGSPFQLEMAFANLGVGILGLVAASRRDGFREATVIMVTVLGVGASFVHVMDMIATGNLAPGNTIQNAANLIKPVFLIPLLLASRHAERSATSEAQTLQFELWRAPLLRSVGIVAAIVATAFAVGFAVGQTLLVSTLGTIAAFALTAIILARSPAHQSAVHVPGRSA